MDFKKGYKTKPLFVREDGTVVFTTTGTNQVKANQKTCEAYGYTYNPRTNVCTAFKSSSRVSRISKNTTNIVGGTGIVTGTGTEKTLISGQKHRTDGDNLNDFITGYDHTISEGINNASIIGGTMGVVTRQGEILQGCGVGTFDSPVGTSQRSVVMGYNRTSSASAVELYIQGDSTSHILQRENSILGFEAYVIGLVVGGSAGTAGEFIYVKEFGSNRKATDGTMTLARSQEAITNNGDIDHTIIMTAHADKYLYISATGATNVSMEWSCTVYIHEIYTNTTEF